MSKLDIVRHVNAHHFGRDKAIKYLQLIGLSLTQAIEFLNVYEGECNAD